MRVYRPLCTNYYIQAELFYILRNNVQAKETEREESAVI